MKPLVLIADGDSNVSRTWRELLVRRGYQVDMTSNGLDCLVKAVRGPKPDILVLDLELPWGGGRGVLTWLRDALAPRGLPPVIMTTRHCVGDGDFSTPVTAQLRKPFGADTLADTIAGLVPPAPARLRRVAVSGWAR